MKLLVVCLCSDEAGTVEKMIARILRKTAAILGSMAAVTDGSKLQNVQGLSCRKLLK